MKGRLCDTYRKKSQVEEFPLFYTFSHDNQYVKKVAKTRKGGWFKNILRIATFMTRVLITLVRFIYVLLTVFFSLYCNIEKNKIEPITWHTYLLIFNRLQKRRFSTPMYFLFNISTIYIGSSSLLNYTQFVKHGSSPLDINEIIILIKNPSFYFYQ